ncbi:MAG TPA: DUF983 domain-containing protein [Bdellovibrionota bacterium]|nr:DUF983 domain-containing protein [Bdellovibrionota bacterium]
MKSSGPAKIRLSSILRARCPACHEGPVLKRVFGIHRRCSACGHDFHPEPGFYLGAMAISYLLTAMLTIPPMIVLKLVNVDTLVLIAFPLVEFIFLGSFLMVYSRVLWLHLEYRMTSRLDRS